jgi:molybdenum cofactor cytidylyltransferase
MPVDPGNLLLLGDLDGVPVLGAPGCARSPRENGFDWVLQRLLAGLAVGRAEIQSLGVGGLLMEIYSRPQPRSPAVHAEAPPIAAVILAAGRSTRMGANKLLAPLEGKPVVRHVAEAALACRASPVLVVTGHDEAALRQALEGLAVTFVANPHHEEGMASSLRAGIAAVPPSAAAALVLLGDMPLVTDSLIDRLIDNYAAQPELKAVTPVAEGRRANPVLIARALFGALETLTGDVGARRVLEDAGEGVLEVLVDEDAVLLDVDTPEALARARELKTRDVGARDVKASALKASDRHDG